jgi:hypothetical protein
MTNVIKQNAVTKEAIKIPTQDGPCALRIELVFPKMRNDRQTARSLKFKTQCCLETSVTNHPTSQFYVAEDLFLKRDSFRATIQRVPVATAWRVLRSWMEERPPIWRVAANKLNKQSRAADKVWSSSLGFGRGANNSSP